MARSDAFKVEGVVVETLGNRTFRIELANGHRLVGFVTGRERLVAGGWQPGERVLVEVSPYDLSEGRIIGKI